MFQGCPTMQRLAAVNGLVALVGSESYLIQVRNRGIHFVQIIYFVIFCLRDLNWVCYLIRVFSTSLSTNHRKHSVA